ncbi:MAG TPA: flagellar export protein FliJ [Pirellulales bacterium]|jgi:flagellar export protein FliJ
MPNFVFRLQSVLQVRAAQRDQRRQEMAGLLASEQSLQDRLAELDGELHVLSAELANWNGAIDLAHRLDVDRYAMILRADRKQVEQAAIELDAKITLKRQELLTADRDVRSLEKLREQQQEAFAADQRRREQRELDEVAARAPVSLREV